MSKPVPNDSSTTAGETIRSSLLSTVLSGGFKATDCITKNLQISAPPKSSGDPLREDLPYTDNDVVRSVRDEMARTVEDVLARRTRTLFLNAAAAIEMAPKVAETIARELGKDDEWSSATTTDFIEMASKYKP